MNLVVCLLNLTVRTFLVNLKKISHTVSFTEFYIWKWVYTGTNKRLRTPISGSILCSFRVHHDYCTLCLYLVLILFLNRLSAKVTPNLVSALDLCRKQRLNNLFSSFFGYQKQYGILLFKDKNKNKNTEQATQAYENCLGYFRISKNIVELGYGNSI